MLLGRFSLGLCSLHDSIPVLGRSVKRVESQALASCVDDVVTRTSRHDNAIARTDLVTVTIDYDFSLSLLDSEKLVAILMNFLTDLFAFFERHHNQLNVLPGIENMAKVPVVLCLPFDITYEPVHFLSI